ncbi:MAG: lipoyl protein ligase domain-containing protein [Bdellovibrionia bacterium]
MLFSCTEIHRHTPETPWRFQELDQRQREIAEALRAHKRSGVLLLSELAPVITFGRRTPQEDLFLSSPLGATDPSSIPRVATDRGGFATYHGPGQWVLFPVERLESLVGDPRGVKKAVHALLEIALEVGLQYDPSSHIRWGAELGVWSTFGKFASVGIRVEDGVLLHGLSINGFRTEQSFLGFRPCGLSAQVDFLLDRSVYSPASLPEGLAQHFEHLGRQILAQAQHRFRKNTLGEAVSSQL